MFKLGFPKKLISVTKEGIKETRYQFTVDSIISEKFEFMTSLEQSDTL